MRFLTFILFILLTKNLSAQEIQFNPGKKYQPDSLRSWTTSVMKGTSEKHPGFYRYTSKENFDNLIDSTVNTITDSLTELDYYRKLIPLIAQIGCLHTGLSLSKEYQSYIDKTPTLIPIEIFIDSSKRILITKDYDVNQDIQIGSEVISINGRSITNILNILLKAIPSDGINQTEKILNLNHRFAFWYQAIIEVTQTFELEVKINGVNTTFKLKGVTKDAFPSLKSLETNYAKTLEFEVVDKIGILKVHSFAKTAVKEKGQNFKKFMKSAFKTMEEEKIGNLVLDLRYNTGGTDGNAALLASYFFDRPFRYWDKIEVTEGIAQEIKGLNRLFYRKPLKVGSSFKWRKIWLTKEFDYYETQKPSRNNFKGKTFIITNGLSMSSCSDFTAILSHNKKAIVVGQETGGGFQGNTSGMIPTAKIPTGLQLTIPLQKYTNAVDLTKNFAHGTIPDYEVTPTFDNWINKKDPEMELVLKLINESIHK